MYTRGKIKCLEAYFSHREVKEEKKKNPMNMQIDYERNEKEYCYHLVSELYPSSC